jgi:hypothetical protein
VSRQVLASEFLDLRLAGHRLACRWCGLVDSLSLRYDPRGLRSVECLCGEELAWIEPLPLLVPFGRQRGLPLDEADDSTIEWLHSRDLVGHRAVREECCALLGCGGAHEPEESD